jgi:hypothetical protein
MLKPAIDTELIGLGSDDVAGHVYQLWRHDLGAQWAVELRNGPARPAGSWRASVPTFSSVT